MKKTEFNLVPDCVNSSPDYYCTWQTQLFATCDGKPEKQRGIIGEKALFCDEKPYGWAYFYEKARGDLFFVMDDSWDVPLNGDNKYYGSLILNEEKFPATTKNAINNTEAMSKLTESIKTLGWKGLGGWVCATESKILKGDDTSEEYWTKRIKEANQAGVSYWKVDWGENCGNAEFRIMLTELAKKYAPGLVIEHAMVPDVIPHSDVFRTYDVPAIMSIPMTMNKLCDILSKGQAKESAMGLINCEDEAYMAAAGGFSMGIMRHPYAGAFCDGRADMSFPAVHRNLKTKIFEVVRATRWHRLAPAFGVSGDVKIDKNILEDCWNFENKAEEIEEWWFDTEFSKYVKDETVVINAPAQLARGCKLAKVTLNENGDVPYIVISKNSDGVLAVATLGRTMGRTYKIPECDVEIDAEDSDVIGVFGEYKNLLIETNIKRIKRILMQDLAGDMAYDITDNVKIADDVIVIPGSVIHSIGTEMQPDGDTSEPGVIIKLEK